MAMWDDVKKNLTDWYGVAADKTGELAKVGVRRYDIFGLSRDIERQFSEIGSLVYGALNEGRDDVLEDPLLLALVDKVRGLESDLQAKEREIADIKAETETRHAAKAEAGGAAAAAAGAEEGPETVEAEIVEDEADPADAVEPDPDDVDGDEDEPHG